MSSLQFILGCVACALALLVYVWLRIRRAVRQREHPWLAAAEKPSPTWPPEKVQP